MGNKTSTPKVLKVAMETESFTKYVLKQGSGATPGNGQEVTVHADLFLRDKAAAEEKGTAIWSTHLPNGFLFPAKDGKYYLFVYFLGPQPFTYRSGVGAVIRGWDEGVATMCVGEKARLVIPWAHAYGANGYAGFKIPAKADLVFEISVLSFK